MKRDPVLSSDSRHPPSRTERLLDVACPYAPVLTIFFSIALLFALLSVLVMAATPIQSEPFVVSLMTLAVDGIVLLLTGPVLYLCRKHRFT